MNLKSIGIGFGLLFTFSIHANQSFIEKVNLAKQQVDLALSEIGGGPERHRALIAAYWMEPGDFILDIGAHIGNFSRFYSYLVGPNGLVFAYEASPPIYQYIVSLFSRLSITNIIPKNRAISDTTNSIIPMQIYPNDISFQSCTVEQMHWNKERMPGDTTIVEVLTEKIDDILEDSTLPPVRFIKIDTEGHEHAVIRGARQLLLTQRPLVIFEYGFQKGYWEPDTIQQMEELGYLCYDCATDQPARPGYGSQAVPCLLTDILAVPIEFEDRITEVLPYLY